MKTDKTTIKRAERTKIPEKENRTAREIREKEALGEVLKGAVTAAELLEAAAKAGAAEVTVASVTSTSRFTMEVTLQKDPDAWPNRTLGKYYGIRVRGQ